MAFTFTRRGFLASIGVATASTSLVSCSSDDVEQKAIPISRRVRPFDGTHQSGIVDSPQAHMNLLGFDFVPGVTNADIQRVLRIWTESARAMTQGKAALADLEVHMADNPGELTITVGFGPSFFELADLSDKRPQWLKPLPAFSRDRLDDRFGQVDIVVQICSHDATTVAHTARVLSRGVAQYARIRWSQEGFLSSPDQLDAGHTPRNLLGFKDGTVNPSTDAELSENVWIDSKSVPGQQHLANGTAMIVRRVRFDLDDWDILDVHSREVVFGRAQDTGAPLGKTDEFDEVDTELTNQQGLPYIDPHSHVALAEERPEQTRIRRRAYNYNLPRSYQQPHDTEAGLVFVCFQNDPESSFIPIQNRLNDSDRLNQWITHIGSSIFYCPSGTQAPKNTNEIPDFWGSELFS